MASRGLITEQPIDTARDAVYDRAGFEGFYFLSAPLSPGKITLGY
ncbi:MAG TPA: hypothetical protein VLD60_12495 [Nitrospira sp.]|nr:hypothetical protein [Nitrospira sp.]